MQLALFSLCAFMAVFSGAMAQYVPHYNGLAINLDYSAPYITKITGRIDTAAITQEQREKEATDILRQTEEHFRQCQKTFDITNPTMIGSLKGCLGRFTGTAMAQISAIESFNRNNAGTNDQSLLFRNLNLQRNSRFQQQTNFNAQQRSNTFDLNENNNENLHQRNLKNRNSNEQQRQHLQNRNSNEQQRQHLQNRNSNEQQRQYLQNRNSNEQQKHHFIQHNQQIDSDEQLNTRKTLKLRPISRERSTERHRNKSHSNESL